MPLRRYYGKFAAARNNTAPQFLERGGFLMKKFWEEFKSFALKGNMMDMAIGVIIGGAFGKISTSLVNDVIMPLISVLTGGVGFSNWKIVLKAAVAGADGVIDPATEVAIKYGSFLATILDFLIIAFFAFPFIIETPYILQLWLKNVPEWSVCFFRFEITRNMLDQLTITLTSAINAEGRIKYYSILRGCSYFLPLPISLFLFHLGFSPYWFYIIWIFTWNGIGSLIILYYAHKNCGMQYADFFKIIIYPILLITISTLSISGIITVYMDESFLRLVIILCTTTIIFIISCCWGFVFSPKERKIILSASMSLLKEIKVKLHL